MVSYSGVWIYAAHAAFWTAFAIALLVSRSMYRNRPTVQQGAARAQQEDAAPHSRGLIWAHALGFGTLYGGIANAVFGGHLAHLFPGQPLAGVLIIAIGALLCCWALLYFASWRFRAAVEIGHELATGGPFRHLRHPIYMSFNLLALGSALWLPTPILWAAFALMVIGSDLRARAEESLLLRTFGDAYASYCSRTRRFVPLVY